MFRDELIQYLRKEIIGPDPVAPEVQENGEEILSEPPRLRYGSGMLFPIDAEIGAEEQTDEVEKQIIESQAALVLDSSEAADGDMVGRGAVGREDLLDEDDTVALANAHFPSAAGFSCFLNNECVAIKISVSAGKYHQSEVQEASKSGQLLKRVKFYRRQILWSEDITCSTLPDKSGLSKDIKIVSNAIETGLEINIRNRSSKSSNLDAGRYYTFTLVNRLKSSGKSAKNENIFFQVSFGIEAIDTQKGFLPYRTRNVGTTHSDEKSNSLLYRNSKTYAVGHGCAVSWDEPVSGWAASINTEMIPVYDLKPVVPTSLPDVSLGMIEMSDKGDIKTALTSLTKLCNAYEDWIDEQAKTAQEELSGVFLATADGHIEKCRAVLIRMRKGVELINSNKQVLRAFTLMNRAMLLQQLRYGMRLREWKREGRELIIDSVNWPDIHDKTTWSNSKLGGWRPFQIAFILLNLESLTDPLSTERNFVDLIWFPTGGGKTEAYLGLTAFTIFLRRLRDKNDIGTSVLMRYTLRLLTAQQFQRAASLICACENIRKEFAGELGTDRISIGLWVGLGLTPNKRESAVHSFNQMLHGNKENPFIILKCPWCGAQFGQIKCGSATQIKGYRKSIRPSTVFFQCHDPDCDFSKSDNPIPAYVIDEDIYDKSPSLIIGTVDKFAMIPWLPESRTIFGFRDSGRVSPPEMIIQDELHLISGPLGSMVGHYETLISELCALNTDGIRITPKIIASTATISRASEQCHALYGCGLENVFLFPPQCLEAGESFFAKEDREVPGRTYIGVHAAGLSSHATAQIFVISALLQASKSIDVKNPLERNGYWTLLNYFSSIRELGHAATLINADIREHLNAMWSRRNISGDKRRFINKYIELTSRINSSEIPEKLQELEVSYTGEKDNYPVDICLATNMISVGVDVQRLGMMAVIGQPKTTSEYIQATSRVGRSAEYPGLVVVIYNTGKPRDRSHYEHFVPYHASIYSHVEPTSVTPFSTPVRERALHALLVGFIRLLGRDVNRKTPQPLPTDMDLDRFRDVLKERITNIDKDEIDGTFRLLEERINEWARYLPPIYGNFATPTAQLQLMYPAGTFPHPDWEEKSWQTPTSMRSVDASCEAATINEYN